MVQTEKRSQKEREQCENEDGGNRKGEEKTHGISTMRNMTITMMHGYIGRKPQWREKIQI
jgi:hypothetical protein